MSSKTTGLSNAHDGISSGSRFISHCLCVRTVCGCVGGFRCVCVCVWGCGGGLVWFVGVFVFVCVCVCVCVYCCLYPGSLTSPQERRGEVLWTLLTVVFIWRIFPWG